mgnify:CR=1 FL=1
MHCLCQNAENSVFTGTGQQILRISFTCLCGSYTVRLLHLIRKCLFSSTIFASRLLLTVTTLPGPAFTADIYSLQACKSHA